MTGGCELTNVELQVGHGAIAGSAQGGAAEIEACLLKRGKRLADLRIVAARRAERLARLLQRGLRILDLRLGLVQLRFRLVALRRWVNAYAHQFEDARRLLADVSPLGSLLDHSRLGRIHRCRRG